MIRGISSSSGLPDFKSILLVNLPEMCLLCWLGDVTHPPYPPCRNRLNTVNVLARVLGHGTIVQNNKQHHLYR